jgi:metal-responsive CopG/Arc/MetJ family transcriptional regulator
MKQVFTVSIDEELVEKIREYSRNGVFRNKSHLVEEAIKRYFSDGNP